MEYPNYYGILPAAVRYAKIPDRAKILFSEITALANKDGYCHASNGYFADLYRCTPQAISKMIKRLEDVGFIRSVIFFEGKQVTERRIYPLAMVAKIEEQAGGYQPQVDGGINHRLRGYQPQVEDNNTSINITSKNREHSREILTDENFKNQLKEKFPAVNIDIEIDKAIDWLSANGRRYKNYAAFMRNWLRREAARQLEILKKEGKIYTPAPRSNPAPAPIKRDNMHLL